MIVIYDQDGTVFAITRSEDRTRLIDSPNPIIEIDDVPENRALILDILRSPTGTYKVVGGVLFKDSTPITLATDINWRDFKDTYLAVIARLEQIQNVSSIPFTQQGFNQVVQAVKDIAHYQEIMIKLLVNRFIIS